MKNVTVIASLLFFLLFTCIITLGSLNEDELNSEEPEIIFVIEALPPPVEPINCIIYDEVIEATTEEEFEVMETSTYEESSEEVNIDEYKEDAKIIAKLLYGECRGVESTQEKAAVVWCVLNRVDSSDNYYPDSISGVITQKNHFAGYNKSNPILPELLNIAEDVLYRWQKEKLGYEDVGRVLPSDYLWFHGNGEENIFRNYYKGNSGSVWNWSLPNPYEN